MALTRAAAGRVDAIEIDTPQPAPDQVLVRVLACGVCRTDLHVVDGELHDPAIPLIPGHEIVGTVEAVGDSVSTHAVGDRVGVPWLGWACGVCEFCRSERENLCPRAKYTGYQINGGYAEYAVADASFCFSLPAKYDNAHAAPLLCAGLIGYRAYRMTGSGTRIGVYGFGAAAHIITQVAVQQGRDVYAFVKPGDDAAVRFARDMGAAWAGYSNSPPPRTMDSAILFAPIGALVPEALSHVTPGGVVVCAGIHMSDIPSFPYQLLWQERMVRSVANLTRQDAREFLAVAGDIELQTHIHAYPLEDANQALGDVRNGRLSGAAVLIP
ncbi:MAG TPA: zinc-dependent alcohol dehydrogenase family protein [Vicinamibacterales bacterium]|nr:zinc-dependent alcohol dehydrogenase family protein [Vicinamibacterales bacterium]